MLSSPLPGTPAPFPPQQGTDAVSFTRLVMISFTLRVPLAGFRFICSGSSQLASPPPSASEGDGIHGGNDCGSLSLLEPGRSDTGPGPQTAVAVSPPRRQQRAQPGAEFTTGGEKPPPF